MPSENIKTHLPNAALQVREEEKTIDGGVTVSDDRKNKVHLRLSKFLGGRQLLAPRENYLCIFCF